MVVINSPTVLKDITRRADLLPEIARIRNSLLFSDRSNYDRLRLELALDLNLAHSMQIIPDKEKDTAFKNSMHLAEGRHMQGLTNMSTLLQDTSGAM